MGPWDGQGQRASGLHDQCREDVGAEWGGESHGPCTVPSGKHTKNYGKSPFFMGKSTINHHFQ